MMYFALWPRQALMWRSYPRELSVLDSGTTLFEAKALLGGTEGLDIDDLRTELEGIAQDIMVEISLEKS